MSAKLLFRISSVILAIFAVGHTFGFLAFRAPTADGMRVFEAMNSVHFAMHGKTFSYGGFYTAFGLFVTAYLLFSAVLAWQLGSFSATYADVARSLGATLFAVQIAGLALAVVYFATPQIAFSAIVAALVGGATLQSHFREIDYANE